MTSVEVAPPRRIALKDLSANLNLRSGLGLAAAVRPNSRLGAPRRGSRRSIAELRALAAEGATLCDEGDAQQIAAWVAATFPGTLAVASSMADAVLPHLISSHAPGVDVLFLDTGFHFPETLATRDLVAARLPVRVVTVRPKLTPAEQAEAHGPDLNRRDPALCCRLRKVEPLAEALLGYEAWVTGLRRDETAARAGAPAIAFDERHQLVKVNPLVTWGAEAMLAYAELHHVPTNPLLSDGYPSIGCLPCTSRVDPGQDPRAGRWAGLGKTECGIHL